MQNKLCIATKQFIVRRGGSRKMSNKYVQLNSDI